MANDNNDALTTGALLLGGGFAGYAVGRWIVDRLPDTQPTQPTATAPAAPLSTASATLSAASAPTPVALAPPPSVEARTASAPARPKEHPMTRTDSPVTSPDQVDQPRVAAHAPDVPVSSPDQIDGAPAGAELIDPYPDLAPGAGLPRRFDPVFDRYRGVIPIEYLRALVARESDTNPSVRTGHAIGLMQIVPIVLADYNTRHGTHYQSEHLVDPAINVAIGCELLRIIITGYAKNHPRIPNLQADWTNPRFAELLTLGWNAGFSEAGGVGRVARYLEHHGITDLTIDLVSRTAPAAGATHHLSNPAKVRWCKSVAALYAKERSVSRNGPRNARRAGRYGREGRTILRDGVPILHVERVDLGDQRYAISPHEADKLTQRIVRSLNGRR